MKLVYICVLDILQSKMINKHHLPPSYSFNWAHAIEKSITIESLLYDVMYVFDMYHEI